MNPVIREKEVRDLLTTGEFWYCMDTIRTKQL
jgi:hypothetical protein